MWVVGDAYEAYIGRWSRPIGAAFLRWLAVSPGGSWADVGCGTGALTSGVLALADPARVIGVDPAAGFLAAARARITDPRATFCVGDAQALPLAGGQVDAVVSGLALNFVPDPARAAAELARVVTPGGLVAAYVWDYAEGMQLLRYFWDAAAALDRDEGERFPLCRPEPLTRLWVDAGFERVTVEAIEQPTVFADFDDYWTPFLGGQGPAPAYVASLPEDRRDALRDLLRERLPVAADGSISLTARAWAVRGYRASAW